MSGFSNEELEKMKYGKLTQEETEELAKSLEEIKTKFSNIKRRQPNEPFHKKGIAYHKMDNRPQSVYKGKWDCSPLSVEEKQFKGARKNPTPRSERAYLK